MSKLFKVKNLIKLGFAVYLLYQFYDTWLQLGRDYSSGAAAGFMMGLVFMAVLFLTVKCVGFVYDVIRNWFAERKDKRRVKMTAHDTVIGN